MVVLIIILKTSERIVHGHNHTIKPITTSTTNIVRWKCPQVERSHHSCDAQTAQSMMVSLFEMSRTSACVQVVFMRRTRNLSFGSAARLAVLLLPSGHSATESSKLYKESLSTALQSDNNTSTTTLRLRSSGQAYLVTTGHGATKKIVEQDFLSARCLPNTQSISSKHLIYDNNINNN